MDLPTLLRTAIVAPGVLLASDPVIEQHPALLRYAAPRCPVRLCRQRFWRRQHVLGLHLVHIEKAHGWSREKIANWIEESMPNWPTFPDDPEA
jgi:hypothetical protein